MYLYTHTNILMIMKYMIVVLINKNNKMQVNLLYHEHFAQNSLKRREIKQVKDMKRGKDAIKVKERCCIRDKELSKICRKMFKKRSIYLISNKRLKPQMERLNNCNLKKKNNRATNAVCVISIDLQLIHVLACNVFILIMKCHL